MRYCLEYNSTKSDWKKADSVLVKLDIFNEKDIKNIIHLIKTLDQELVISLVSPFEEYISEEEYYLSLGKQLKEAVAARKNDKSVKFCCDSPLHSIVEKDYNEYILSTLLKLNDLPFYFSDYITNWEALNYISTFNVTDVIIAESLCFSLSKVRQVVGEDVQIRVIPDVIQAYRNKKTNGGIRNFFIRPEDVPYYEEYVDVMELWNYNDGVMYDIYAKDKYWYGNLNEIITGLDVVVDNRSIWTGFGANRVNCNQNCMQGGNCRICDRVIDLANTLSEHDVELDQSVDLQK